MKGSRFSQIRILGYFNGNIRVFLTDYNYAYTDFPNIPKRTRRTVRCILSVRRNS